MTNDKSSAETHVGLATQETPIPGLFSLQMSLHEDSRGSFLKLLNQDELCSLGWPSITHQVNLSSTPQRGTIRGMHAQPGTTPEYKLVSCIRGAVWDVCVDLRKDSPTFLHWEAFELSGANPVQLFIPPGVAHGFQATSGEVELVYCHSAPYEPDLEVGVSPFDPLINISWPLEVTSVSARDMNHPPLSTSFEGLSV